jgi:hypothetical protein
MSRLPFLDAGYEHVSVRDFWKLKEHNLPQEAGVYFLLALPGLTFMYPRRRSSVFYIGKANNLRERLYSHLRYAEEAREDRRYTLYWPYYEYAATIGARYTFILAKPRHDPRELEENVLASFAEHYRSWPVANGVGGWNSLLTLNQLKKRRKSG